MELNADFSQRAVVHGARTEWISSPSAGVDRRMLDRIGGEVARATTIVRFAPNSRFSRHVHTGGEEFLVLEGVFEDEHGAFPAGSYIRNPPQSAHTPGSTAGCTIFVKLWQFDLADRTHVRTDTTRARYIPDPDRAGVEVLPLFHDSHEDVVMERWAPGAEVALNARGGIEMLVVEGGFASGGDNFEPQSWMRLPKGETGLARTGPRGALVWIKRDHLARTPRAPQV